jgi:hypothetical protein
MVLAKSWGITSVVALLGKLLSTSEATLRQRVREWCYDATDTQGEQRQAVEVSTCFGSLLRWGVAWWPATERRLALAMESSNLTARFTVRCISVLERGCAIPVAWKLIRVNEPGRWDP